MAMSLGNAGMHCHQRATAVLHILIFVPLAFAQTPSPTTLTSSATPSDKAATTTSKPTAGADLNPSYSSSSYAAFPTGNGGGGGSSNSGGMSTYYLAGLVLILFCLGLALFFMFRRRVQAVAMRRRTGNRAEALQRDVASPESNDPRTGHSRYARGMRRGLEDTGEEGLNEFGEAPPAYLPGATRRPGIPLRTLSREDVGLKPPDYNETTTYEVDSNVRDSAASASSARTADHQTHP